jgi:rare lipoprotein A
MHADDMTAAHRTLPFGTSDSVVNNRNGRTVVVRIKDTDRWRAVGSSI